MNRRNALALGATIAAGAAFAGRWSLPRYRVTLWSRNAEPINEMIGQWEVSAIERHTPLWEDYADGFPLWIEPHCSDAARGVYGLGWVDHRDSDRPWDRRAWVYGVTPWGDEDATRALVATHGGLGLSWERLS